MKLKQLLMIFAVVFIVFSMSITAFSYEMQNPDQTGSVKVSMRYDNKVVSGGTLTLYHIGTLVQIDSQKTEYVLTQEFADSDMSLKDLESSDLAKTLFSFAKSNSIGGTMKEIGPDGNVLFENLSVGLYLLAQEDAAPGGYAAAEPFIISVPMEENGIYTYDVEASPKLSLKNEPTTSDTPSNPDPAPEPPKTTLPYTGQLNWPIPILIASGLLMLICGWILYFGKRKNNEA